MNPHRRLAAPSPAPDVASPSTPVGRRRTTVLVAEVGLAVAVVVFDLGVATFALLALAAVSLRMRREGLGSLGLRRPDTWTSRRDGWVLAGKMLAFSVVWSLFQLSVTMPIANHVSGSEPDTSQFDDIEGNVVLLLAFLALSWTLAALGEEIAYRGYVMTRVRELAGGRRLAVAVAVLVTSVLFGFAHSEQGLVGVIVIAVDAVAFSVLRLRYDTLWAAVLAHGWNNTIGFVAFFLVGPVHAFW